jgi:hypothetical protein
MEDTLAKYPNLDAFIPTGGFPQFRQDYFCLEPVSHVADGFNMLARGVEGTGCGCSGPGSSWAGRCGFGRPLEQSASADRSSDNLRGIEPGQCSVPGAHGDVLGRGNLQPELIQLEIRGWRGSDLLERFA